MGSEVGEASLVSATVRVHRQNVATNQWELLGGGFSRMELLERRTRSGRTAFRFVAMAIDAHEARSRGSGTVHAPSSTSGNGDVNTSDSLLRPRVEGDLVLNWQLSAGMEYEVNGPWHQFIGPSKFIGLQFPRPSEADMVAKVVKDCIAVLRSQQRLSRSSRDGLTRVRDSEARSVASADSGGGTVQRVRSRTRKLRDAMAVSPHSEPTRGLDQEADKQADGASSPYRPLTPRAMHASSSSRRAVAELSSDEDAPPTLVVSVREGALQHDSESPHEFDSEQSAGRTAGGADGSDEDEDDLYDSESELGDEDGTDLGGYTDDALDVASDGAEAGNGIRNDGGAGDVGDDGDGGDGGGDGDGSDSGYASDIDGSTRPDDDDDDDDDGFGAGHEVSHELRARFDPAQLHADDDDGAEGGRRRRARPMSTGSDPAEFFDLPVFVPLRNETVRLEHVHKSVSVREAVPMLAQLLRLSPDDPPYTFYESTRRSERKMDPEEKLRAVLDAWPVAADPSVYRIVFRASSNSARAAMLQRAAATSGKSSSSGRNAARRFPTSPLAQAGKTSPPEPPRRSHVERHQAAVLELQDELRRVKAELRAKTEDVEHIEQVMTDKLLRKDEAIAQLKHELGEAKDAARQEAERSNAAISHLSSLTASKDAELEALRAELALPSKQGWVRKLEDGKWLKRWFATHGNMLLYYKVEETTGTACYIRMGDVTAVRAIDTVAEDDAHAGCAFEIRIPGRRYKLLAPRPIDRRKWLDVLAKRVDWAKTHPASASSAAAAAGQQATSGVASSAAAASTEAAAAAAGRGNGTRRRRHVPPQASPRARTHSNASRPRARAHRSAGARVPEAAAS